VDRIGRYKIVRELGRGAMGVVYHAIDPNIGRAVAIKTIQLGGSRPPDEQNRLRERLFREARSAGVLSHPGIVTIYDVEQQGDLAYIAMEYVDGPTLDQLLSEQPLAPERMCSLLGQTAVALDYAHQKGIVHRDIKPANVMIAADGTVKITDFGIAKVTASEQFTMTGSIVGTPHYMSPEQVQGQPVDGRSDQFSLAVIAYEMLTGEKPFTGEHLTTVVYKIVAEEPVTPRRLNPTVGGAIENVLHRALAKKPEARYRTCQEFIDSLEKACAATKGWKTMPRGGTLSAPTAVEAARPAIALPPARRARGGNATATAERAVRKKSGFLPFLAAILMAAALIVLLASQLGPWVTSRSAGQPAAGGEPKTSKREPAPAAPAVPLPNAATAENKPSPMPPPPEMTKPEPPANLPPILQPESKSPVAEQATKSPASAEGAKSAPPKTTRPSLPALLKPPVPPAAASQAVTIVSSPGGATATLDGRSDVACTTPCSLDAAPGRHTLAVTMPGYQVEHREVQVGTGPLELPAVILRAMEGTLMLSSVPAGAGVLVNGKRIVQTTPAVVSLPPGSYAITVEKDGKQASEKVEIRNGTITTLKVFLGQ